MSSALSVPIRRFAPAACMAAALLVSAAIPSAASAKAGHHHAHRNQAPARACTPDELTMVGSGKAARLYVCGADGAWTEALFATPAKGGQTHVVNAGRA